MVFVNYTDDIEDLKAIDHERDIVFRCVKFGNPQAIYGFMLDWHGQQVYFEGKFVDTSTTTKCDIEWKLNGIYIPEGFLESRDGVFKVICESLEAYGVDFDPDYGDGINRVKVITPSVKHYDFEMPDLSPVKNWWNEEDE